MIAIDLCGEDNNVGCAEESRVECMRVVQLDQVFGQ